MDKDSFITLLRNSTPEGTVFENSHKHSLTIISTSKDRLHYSRGKNTRSLKFSQLYKTWQQFRGEQVTSDQLKAWKPALYDSNALPRAGHDSNCGLFMLLMEQLGLACELERKGRTYSARLLDAC